MPSVAATVHIVDDDPHICESLSLMVRDTGLAVRTYPSAEAFLDSCPEFSHEPQCLVLDVRMPGLDGLSLQQILHARGKHIPTIMISGSADVRMAVQAMIAGAVVFLEKPFGQDALLSRIREALERDTRRQQETARSTEVAGRLETLSIRQRQVLDRLVAGKHAKQIANELGIGEKTVAKHRAMVMEKMQVDSVVDLVRLMAGASHGYNGTWLLAAPISNVAVAER
jgi:FixJ family two-component response regulator